MQIKERQFNIHTSQSTTALHLLDEQHLLYFEDTKQLLRWASLEVFCFAIELDTEKNCKYYEKLACPAAHKILWLSNEEFRLGIRLWKGQMINDAAIL